MEMVSCSSKIILHIPAYTIIFYLNQFIEYILCIWIPLCYWVFQLLLHKWRMKEQKFYTITLVCSWRARGLGTIVRTPTQYFKAKLEFVQISLPSFSFLARNYIRIAAPPLNSCKNRPDGTLILTIVKVR